jgi:FkbM family methyltransferase
MPTKIVDNLIFHYRPGTEDESVISNIKDLIEQFVKLPEYFPKEGDTLIDVGGHIGTFALMAATRIPNSRVYSIEACEETYEFLIKNIQANNLTSVYPFHLALDKTKGTTKLFYNTKDGNWGHTIVKSFSNQGEEVATDTLTNFMTDQNIKLCDYMKLNCEGAEFNILLHTPKDILAKCKLILILYHLDLAEEASLDELKEHLKVAGFRLRFFKRRPLKGWLIARNKKYPLNLGQWFILRWRIFCIHLKRLKAIPQRFKMLLGK